MYAPPARLPDGAADAPSLRAVGWKLTAEEGRPVAVSLRACGSVAMADSHADAEAGRA